MTDLIARHRPGPAAPAARRVTKALGTAAVVALALTGVLLSPFALEEISGSRGADWNRLSQAGAAYGFTSAIVSALALTGVAVSLIVQNRQARAEQIQGIRSYYLELVRLELDDMALFQPVWGATDIVDPDERKRHVYADLLMNYAWMGFEIRSIPESLLRDMLAGMFTGEAGRDHWRRARTSWTARTSGSRVGRRFLRIVGEEHARRRRGTTGSPTARPRPALRSRSGDGAPPGGLGRRPDRPGPRTGRRIAAASPTLTATARHHVAPGADPRAVPSSSCGTAHLPVRRDRGKARVGLPAPPGTARRSPTPWPAPETDPMGHRMSGRGGGPLPSVVSAKEEGDRECWSVSTRPWSTSRAVSTSGST
ncbi:DUF6082 family protein [Streptomyces sp. NPDC044984]|uniref:DUF6082 family protein n=1 Tax=Streptomyces sp. NPDC044984 TaxID=3154335 RepID=UPI0033F8D01B